MSQSVTGNVKVTGAATETVTDGIGSGSIAESLAATLTFNNGTGSGNINLHYSEDTTLVSTTATRTLSALTDGLGRTVAFTKVRYIIIVNLETTDGHDLIIGAAALHAWGAPVNSVSGGEIVIKAGGCLVLAAPLATALAVTSGTSDQLKLDSGANTVHYQMLIGGEA